MKQRISTALSRLILSLALVLVTTSAQAGPYADDLTKCLVKSTTSDDKSLLVQWIFSMMALHPQVGRLAAVSDAQRTELNKGTALLFQNLLTKTCLTETRQALKYEGGATIQTSFGALGQVAAREIFANPQVEAGMSELGKYVDKKSFESALQSTKTQ